MRRAASTLVVLLALTGAAAAAEDTAKAGADACSSFDWPLTRELAWFSAADLPVLASGSSLPGDHPAAQLELKPTADSGLPQAPSREPKPGTYAGYVRLAAPSAPGEIQVTLSGEGWIDVAQEGGDVLKPGAHSGRKGCASLRKSVRFPVVGKPIVVSVSNATTDKIRIAVTPVQR